MKLITFILLFVFIILISTKTNAIGKPLSKVNKKDISNIKKNTQRNLEDENGYDSYIVVLFNEDCNYSMGFQNKYRNDISFIINKENNEKLTGEDELIIYKGFEIEIHFNTAVKNLEHFFDSYVDKNTNFSTSIDFTNFDSSKVKSSRSLFFGCNILISIDFTNFNTSLIEDMSFMFYGCYSLESLDLSSFNTSLVTKMSYLFYACYSLESLDISSFNTSLVTNMSYMFTECYSLQLKIIQYFISN